MIIVKPINMNNAILQSSNVPEADYSQWLTGTTYAKGDSVIYVDPSATVTITIASPGVITWTGHNLSKNSIVLFSTTGTLPTGIEVSTAYYLTNVTANTFQITEEKNGQPIVTTGTQSGVQTATASIHKVYESLKASNVGKNPLVSPDYWLDLGATNRWLMFDQSLTSQTENPDEIDVVFDVVGLITSVAVLNVRAETIQIIMTDSVAGVVYDETISLRSSTADSSWHSYFFDTPKEDRDFFISDLPSYRNTQIQVIINQSGKTVQCGAIVLGVPFVVGATQYGMSMGQIDFSVKTRDSFGNFSFLERGFSRRGEANVWVENGDVDGLLNFLADIRATPALFEMSSSFSSSVIYGIAKDFNLEVQRPTVSLISVRLEGLT